MNATPSAPPPVSLKKIALLIAVLVVIGLVAGLMPRLRVRRQLQNEVQADATPAVKVISPSPAKADLGAPLSADVQPFAQASIHARANGYLRNWHVDIGDRVTNGQLLAEIDTPEVEQQLAQARAQLEQTKAALALAQITADRWVQLLKTASVSEQETAEKTSDLALKKADLAAAQANVQRLEETKKFDNVLAPFDGIIIERNTDIGQLISAAAGPALFRIAQIDPLRIYVHVPQTLIHAVAPGQRAEVIFQDLPGKVFTATVMRSAGAMDAASRTLLVELQMPNPKGEFMAGGFAQVRVKDRADAGEPRSLTLPDNALIFRSQGAQVAVVGGDNKVSLRPIKIGRDFGSAIEILDGVQATDRVIVNPPDAIADGMTVQVESPAQDTATP